MNPVTKALYHDFKTIAYRPELRAITNSVTATILLQQVFFRWVNNDSKPFYKFKEPCNHKLYKPGDSWCEELGFSRAEFDTAWNALATIGIASKKTNMERLTYYTLNESAFDDAVSAVYSSPSKRDIPALRKETFHRHVKTDSSVCSYTENTPEITTKNKEDHFNFRHSPLAGECSQTSNKFDVVYTNAEKSTESEKTKVADEKPTKEAAYLASKAAKQKPEKQKATTKPKKALFASQLDNRSHPFTLAALRALECEIEANTAHNIWVDSKTHRPMVQIAVLDDIEENLQALGEAMEDVNDGDSPVEAACIAVIDFYRDRGMNRKRPVDLSFLSGIGMADSPEGFVDWFSHAIYC
jgi:hypothetical protein